MTIKSRIPSYYNGGRIAAIGLYGSDVVYNGAPSYEQSQIGFTSPGPPFVDPNDFDQLNARVDPYRIYGISRPNKYYTSAWESVPVTLTAPAYNVDRSTNWQALVNQALTQVNPNTPIIDAPNFLWELRELPRGLKQVGDWLAGRANPIRDPGGTYLAWKFGWEPLFNDLDSMLDLAESFQDRIRQLKGASRTKSYKGRLPSMKWSTRDPIKRFYGGSTWVETQVVHHAEQRNWFTTIFELDVDALPDTRDQLAMAKRALGLKTISAAAIWNSIPWTWLIDYFLDIGSFLEANRKGIPFTCRNMCIMSHTQIKSRAELIAQGKYWVDGPRTSGGRGTIDFKRRKVYALPIAAPTYSPFLTGRQIGILAALSTSRSSTFLRGGRGA